MSRVRVSSPAPAKAGATRVSAKAIQRLERSSNARRVSAHPSKATLAWFAPQRTISSPAPALICQLLRPEGTLPTNDVITVSHNWSAQIRRHSLMSMRCVWRAFSITGKHCKHRPSLRNSCNNCKSCMLCISPWANTSLRGTQQRAPSCSAK